MEREGIMQADLDAKLGKYREFWDYAPVRRPMVGFDVGGWFPFQRHADLRAIPEKGFIEPSSLSAERGVADYAAFMERSYALPDDFIKGVSPITAIPWMEGIFGCALQRSGQTVWAKERMASWDELGVAGGGPAGNFSPEASPWFAKYVEYVKALTEAAAGRYPVGMPILRGVVDVLGAVRGHTESIIDLMESPAETKAFGERIADTLIRLTRAHHAATRPFHGGHFIEQYCMWAPGPIVRMQEDATAVFSPGLYEELIQESDRKIARAFPYSLLHLHSSSLFMLDKFLAIKEIGVYQVNRDVGEMGLPELIPFLKRIQEDGRRIFLRGPLSAEDFALVARELSPRGLMVQSVVASPADGVELAQAARRIFGHD